MVIPTQAIPLACAAGLAVINEIIDNNLIKNANEMGLLLRSRLLELKNKYSFIGDVRGKGLLMAFELVADRKTMEPLPTSMQAHQLLVEEAYENGLIIYSRRTRGGLSGDHFMVCPPLIINAEQIDEIHKILDYSLEALKAKLNLLSMKTNPIITIHAAKKEDVNDIHRLLKELAIDTGMEKKMISTIDDLLKYGLLRVSIFMHSWPNVKKKSIGLCLYFFTFSSWMGAPGIFIQDLFVAKKYRKLDIGKKLLHEVVAQNEQQEITHVLLNVDHNNTEAKNSTKSLALFIEQKNITTLLRLQS